MPGVLIIEALAQVSVILVYQTLKRMPDDKSLILFAGIDNARFKRQVMPGDQLTARIDGDPAGARRRQVRGARQVDDALVAEAELLAALRDL